MNAATSTRVGRQWGIFGFPVVAGETTELDIIGRGGGTDVVEMRVVETEWGENAYLASLRDITERKRMEEAQKERLRMKDAFAKTSHVMCPRHL